MLKTKIDMDPANTSTTRYASNVTGATWAFTNTTPGDELARVVTITNDDTTDHSAKTAILTGTDADGKAQIETGLNLPGNGATIVSTKHFLTLLTVVPSATIGSDTMDIGIGDDIVSKTIPLDAFSEIGATVALDVTGTIGVDAELTYDLVNNPDFNWENQASAAWLNSTNLAAKTADIIAAMDQGAQALRMRINTYTDTAELQAWIVQTQSR